jgi:hypothetical protein
MQNVNGYEPRSAGGLLLLQTGGFQAAAGLWCRVHRKVQQQNPIAADSFHVIT